MSWESVALPMASFPAIVRPLNVYRPAGQSFLNLRSGKVLNGGSLLSENSSVRP
jgi:hypothetical protein